MHDQARKLRLDKAEAAQRSGGAEQIPFETGQPAETDAHGLYQLLKDRFASPSEDPVAQVDAVKHAATKFSPTFRRITKALIGAAILITFAIIPLRTLLQTSSVQAVVNSPLVTLRAPIEGRIEVSAPTDWQSFGVVSKGAVLMRVVNSRVSPARLEDIRRQLEHLQNERTGIVAKLTEAKLLQERLVEQVAGFKKARVLQLEARIAEQENIVAASEAKRQEASDAVARATTLFQSGNVTTVDMNRRTRELTMAQQSLNSANNRLQADRIELDAARTGVLIGDGFNDRPTSAQRLDDVTQRVVDLSADLAVLDAELPRLEKAFDEEQARLHSNSEVSITLPIQGRIWEVLTSPGEQVRAGQDLVKIFLIVREW